MDSINDHNDPKSFCCYYVSFNNTVHFMKQHEVGTLSTRQDLTDIFKHMLVHPEDWLLLGSTWGTEQPNGTVQKK